MYLIAYVCGLRFRFARYQVTSPSSYGLHCRRRVERMRPRHPHSCAICGVKKREGCKQTRPSKRSNGQEDSNIVVVRFFTLNEYTLRSRSLITATADRPPVTAG